MVKIPLPPKSGENPLMASLGLSKSQPELVTPASVLRDSPDVTGNMSGESSMAYSLDDIFNLISSGSYPDASGEMMGELDNYIYNLLLRELEAASPDRSIMDSLAISRAPAVDPDVVGKLKTSRQDYQLGTDSDIPAMQGDAYNSALFKIIEQSHLAGDSPTQQLALILQSILAAKKGGNIVRPQDQAALLQDTLQRSTDVTSKMGQRPDEITRLLNNVLTRAYPQKTLGQTGQEVSLMQQQMAEGSPAQYQAATPQLGQSGAPQDAEAVQKEMALTALNRLEGDSPLDVTITPEMANPKLEEIQQLLELLLGRNRTPPQLRIG